MRTQPAIVSVLAVALLAGCASGSAEPRTPAASPAGALSPSATVLTPSAQPSRSPAATPAASGSPSPAAGTTTAGPSVLESSTYPYRIEVPGGGGLIDSALVAWDGTQVLMRGGRNLDRARASDGKGLWLVMSPTEQRDLGEFRDDLLGKYASWHGCTEPTAVREFSVRGIPGVSYQQACAGGSERFTRAIVVGDGHGLLAFSEAGGTGAMTQEELIAFLQGLQWAEPR